MPRVPGRTRRLLLSFTVGLSLVAMPGVASADAPVRLTEHIVFLNCDFTEPQANISASVSSRFGSGAFVEVPPDLFGETFEGVTVVDTAGGGATLDAVVPLVDGTGNPAGNAMIAAVLIPNGVETPVEASRFREGNQWLNTVGGLFREMTVSGSFTLPDATLDLASGECSGGIADVQVFETQPHTFVAHDTGMFLDCHWETDTSLASFFAFNDPASDPFAEAFLEVPGEHLLVVSGPPTMTMTAAGITASIPMSDRFTGTEEAATVSATFTLSAPVTSEFLGQNARQVVTEQRIMPTGTLTFSSGSTVHEFALDSEVCFGSAFDSRFVAHAPAGPKPAATTAVNDSWEGAIALTPGKVVNDQTRNTAVAPEVQVIGGCPEFDDAFGHTLWYKVTGTGGEMTLDTAGSNFDTLVAVYDEDLNQLGCIDDVDSEPIGGTLQASITGPTIEGATYYVQIGGFDPVLFSGVSEPEFGRLRIRVSG
jgi:hypothetical protein